MLRRLLDALSFLSVSGNLQLPAMPEPPFFYLAVRDINTGDFVGKKIGPVEYSAMVSFKSGLLANIDIETQYVDVWEAKD